MKISNADVVRLTQIKQYLLDPPHSFRLFTEASTLLDETTQILQKYPFIDAPFYDSFDVSRQEVNEYYKDPSRLRLALIKIGRLLGGLFNR